MNPLPPGAPTRFDLVLLVMGLALAAGALLSTVAGLSPQVAAGASSAVAGLALVDGLVVNPPSDE